VSAVTSKGVGSLLNTISRIVAEQVHLVLLRSSIQPVTHWLLCSFPRVQDFIQQRIPSSYLVLEKALMAHAKTQMPPVLSWAEYDQVAKLCMVEGRENLYTATVLLHNLGSLVHFGDDEKARMQIREICAFLSALRCTLLTDCLFRGGAYTGPTAFGDPRSTMAHERVLKCGVDKAHLLQVTFICLACIALMTLCSLLFSTLL